MRQGPLPEGLYLDHRGGPVAAVFHRPRRELAANIAIMICPPFGWDEVCSYRSRRAWAMRLAAEGFPVVRISYSGTGDSAGSPRDPRRLDAWTDEVALTASWLRAQTGATRVVAIGLELGGLLAVRAVSRAAEIDDLVLWATPASGRMLVRQLRTFSRLQRAQFFKGLPEPPPLPDGDLEAGGFLLTGETVSALQSLDLSSLPLPRSSSRRVLLLDRDGMAIDEALREQFINSGASVDILPGPGYADMCSHPQRSRVPAAVIERVLDWLGSPVGGAARPADRAPHPNPPCARRSARIEVAPGAYVHESHFELAQSSGRLTGILAEPEETGAGPLLVVMLNAGAVRRTGPNRMWVEAARRWGGRGVTTLRLDVQGIGDSDGEDGPYAEDGSLYEAELLDQVLAVLDALGTRGIAERFVLLGLCAGSYWSFRAALVRPDVTAALMVNPRALVWSSTLEPARDVRTLLTEQVTLDRLRRVASVARIRAVLVWLLLAPVRWLRGRLRPRAEELTIDKSVEQAVASGKRLLLVFAYDEDLHDELERSGHKRRLESAPTIRFESIAVRDHTLRPLWAQGQAHQILDRALERELEISRGHTALAEPAK